MDRGKTVEFRNILCCGVQLVVKRVRNSAFPSPILQNSNELVLKI